MFITKKYLQNITREKMLKMSDRKRHKVTLKLGAHNYYSLWKIVWVNDCINCPCRMIIDNYETCSYHQIKLNPGIAGIPVECTLNRDGSRLSEFDIEGGPIYNWQKMIIIRSLEFKGSPIKC